MRRRIVIVGGGFSGAATAIHFAKHAQQPLEIAIIEPRSIIGAGAAYSTEDPMLRLNVQDSLMVFHPDAIDDFPRWLRDSNNRRHDPEGEGDDGQFYAMRKTFAEYMAGEFAAAVKKNASGSNIAHYWDQALHLQVQNNSVNIELEKNGELVCDLAILCLGNEKPSISWSAAPEVLRHSHYISNPWAENRLEQIQHNSDILLIGSSLTAVDMVASLTRCGHRGQITMISRRGLLPHVQGEFPGIEELLRRLSQETPILIQKHGEATKVAQILAWVRADAAAARLRGENWHDALDAVRDAANYIWPRLSLIERRRFIRHLKPFYDSHRFRLAPQIHQIIEQRLRAGRLQQHAARVIDISVAKNRLQVQLRHRGQVQAVSQTFDYVINCTGPNPDPGKSDIALFQNTISEGLLVADVTGVGLAVNERSETLRADGHANRRILALGPIAKGQFPEIVAVPQITGHLVSLTERLLAENLL